MSTPFSKILAVAVLVLMTPVMLILAIPLWVASYVAAGLFFIAHPVRRETILIPVEVSRYD